MLKIGTWDFEGPYSARQLRNEPGVYVVLDVRRGMTSYTCVDVGESDKVAARVGGHDRKRCWIRNTRGLRMLAVLYTGLRGDDYRRGIEQDVRRLASPLCGDP